MGQAAPRGWAEPAHGLCWSSPGTARPRCPRAAPGAAPGPGATAGPAIGSGAAAFAESALSPAPAVSKIAWDQVVRANFSRSRGCR